MAIFLDLVIFLVSFPKKSSYTPRLIHPKVGEWFAAVEA